MNRPHVLWIMAFTISLLASQRCLAASCESLADATVVAPGVERLELESTRLLQLQEADGTQRVLIERADRTHLELLLTRRPVTDDATRIVVFDDDGERPLSDTSPALWSGYRADDIESLAFLSISEWGVFGFIEGDGGLLVISTGRYGEQRDPLLTDLSRLTPGSINWVPFECNVIHVGDVMPVGEGPVMLTADPPCRVAEVAIETDWEFNQSLFGGNEDAAAAYAQTLIGAVSEIFYRDFHVRLEISYLRIWDSFVDPWDGANTGEQLGQFRDYWIANMGDVPRDVAHFLSGRGLGGGVAWLPGICSTWGYAVSANLGGYFPYPLEDYHWQNWDPYVVAHEIGHNFNAPHTHDLVPPVDACGLGDCSDAQGGTIMSYCHTCPGGMTNISLHFDRRIIDERVLPHLQGNMGTCLDVVDPPLIVNHPPDVTQCVGLPVVLSVNVLTEEDITYQWRKDGVPLPDATTDALLVPSVTHDDAGAYDVVITASCDELVTDAGILTVIELTGDLDADGDVDLSDLGALLASFDVDAGGDIDGDGDTDLSDLGALLAHFGERC
jgi:hypothetical protein